LIPSAQKRLVAIYVTCWNSTCCAASSGEKQGEANANDRNRSQKSRPGFNLFGDAYAELKRKLGVPDVIAARAGNTNERIDPVLQKFGVPAPEFLSDVSGTVADVMETNVISVAHDSSIYQAMNTWSAGCGCRQPMSRLTLGLEGQQTFSRIVRERQLRASSLDRSRTSRTPLMASLWLAFPEKSHSDGGRNEPGFL
jgi:hypothetical protein